MDLAEQAFDGMVSGFYRAVLTRLRAPVALVDDQRRLLYCNPSARELLARAHCLMESDGCLYCRRRKDDIILLQTLHHLQLSRTSQSHTTTSEKAFFSVRGDDGATSVGLYFCAIRPQTTLDAFGSRTVAMLLFHESNARVEIDPFIVGATFDLTPAEARVGIALARGRSPDEIAVSNGVSISTVRTQLRALFAKTGTARQTELVGVLASLPVVRLTLGTP
jgi:DNA-binding CsgD family transcriptional regulator